MDNQVLTVIPAVGVWYLATIRRGHIWNGDACMYMLHARNLARGRPYAETGYVYNPAAWGVGPPTYPPVCPALLAPVYRLFGLNLGAMKAWLILCFLASLVGMSLVFSDRLPPPELALVIALIGLHPYIWDAKDRIGSEFPFLLFTFASLALIRAAYAAVPSWPNQLQFGLLVGSSMYMAYGTRGLGIVLLPALVCYHTLNARQLAPFIPFLAVAAMVFTVLVILQHRYLHSDYSRVFHLHLTARAIGAQLLRYLRAAYGLWYDGWGAAHAGLGLILAVCAGLGYAITLRRGVTATDVFPLLYLGSIMLWPVQYELRRFLIPVLPFFVYYAAVGADAIRPSVPGGLGTALAAGLAATVFAWYIARYATTDYGPAPNSITSATATALYAYVKSETVPQDVFVFFDPRILALFTGRRAAAYHRGADDKDLWRFLKEIRATYAVVGPAEKVWFPSFAGFVERYDRYMPVVFRNADFVLRRITGFPSDHPHPAVAERS